MDVVEEIRIWRKRPQIMPMKVTIPLFRPQPVPKSAIGSKVTSVERLFELSMQRKAVVLPHANFTNKPTPAAFIICMPGRSIVNLIRAGMFVYKPSKKKRRTK